MSDELEKINDIFRLHEEKAEELAQAEREKDLEMSVTKETPELDQLDSLPATGHGQKPNPQGRGLRYAGIALTTAGTDGHGHTRPEGKHAPAGGIGTSFLHGFSSFLRCVSDLTFSAGFRHTSHTAPIFRHQ